MTLNKLMAQTQVDAFHNALVDFLYFALIAQPYQGLASKAMLEKARTQIQTAVSSIISKCSYRGTRDIYLYIHLIQGRQSLHERLSQVQRETADENPVEAELLPQLLEDFYSRLKTDFEHHHGAPSRARVTA